MTYVSTILGLRLRASLYAKKMPVGNIFLGRNVRVKYLPTVAIFKAK
jgi:hypothetical protein